MIGLHCHFTFALESCFRLPKLAFIVGSILTLVSASNPVIPSRFWDRKPKATPGRLRNALRNADFPSFTQFDSQIRKKNSVFDYLPKGIAAQNKQLDHFLRKTKELRNCLRRSCCGQVFRESVNIHIDAFLDVFAEYFIQPRWTFQRASIEKQKMRDSLYATRLSRDDEFIAVAGEILYKYVAHDFFGHVLL